MKIIDKKPLVFSKVYKVVDFLFFMATATKSKAKSFEVREGRTEIIVPHGRKKLTFVHPPFGPNTYRVVCEQIDNPSFNLRRPTPEETVSLISSAYDNLGNRYADNIKSIMDKTRFWLFADIEYIPNEGVRITRADGSIREVPFGYRVDWHHPNELAKNEFVIGLFGEKGVDNLAKFATDNDLSPSLLSFDNVDKPTKKVAALKSDLNTRRLYVNYHLPQQHF